MWNFPLQPEQASEHAVEYDRLFMTISALTVLFTIIVGILVLVLAIRYRAGSKADRRNPLDHSLPLELSWSVLPLILAIGIFGWSSINFIKVRTMPKEALEIFVIGKQWMWHLQHMNGVREMNELHIPVGQPVKLTMISQDVLHAMYLPEFRAQYHVVPGRYTNLHFTPTKTGKFKMLCAMHCGTDHSEMVGQVYVLSERDYAAWLENEANRFRPMAENMAEAGKLVFKEKNCGNCHTGQDTVRGPTLHGLIGRQRTFTDGSSAVANEDYVRESIVNPWNRITSGYINTMQSYKGQLSEEQILNLIAYIRTLGSQTMPGEQPAPFAAEPRPTSPAFSAPGNATDVANKAGSAGVTQFRQSEERP